MKNFFQQIRDSVYSRGYYSDIVVPGSAWDSVKYYLKLVALLSLIITVIISALFLPKLVPLVRQGGDKVISYYPEGLEVYIKGGKASTNMVEPYLMPVPREVREKRLDGSLDNLFVIDTKTPFSVEQFEKYNTAVLLKQDAVYYYSKYESRDKKIIKGETAFQPLSKVPDTTINKALASTFLTKLLPIIKFLVPFMVPIIFLGLCFIMIWMLVYLLFAALVVWLVAKVRKFSLTYKQSYQVSTHAITLPLIVYCLLFPFAFALPPFTFTLILVIIAHLNLKQAIQATLPLEQ